MAKWWRQSGQAEHKRQHACLHLHTCKTRFSQKIWCNHPYKRLVTVLESDDYTGINSWKRLLNSLSIGCLGGLQWSRAWSMHPRVHAHIVVSIILRTNTLRGVALTSSGLNFVWHDHHNHTNYASQANLQLHLRIRYDIVLVYTKRAIQDYVREICNQPIT